MKPDDPRLDAMAFKQYAQIYGGTGQKIATGQEQAVTSAIDKDDTLRGLNERLGDLTLTPKLAAKNAAVIEDVQKQIAARERYLRNRVLRQPQDQAAPGADGGGGGRIKVDAQGNIIS
jgi:hypothetical protein